MTNRIREHKTHPISVCEWCKVAIQYNAEPQYVPHAYPVTNEPILGWYTLCARCYREGVERHATWQMWVRGAGRDYPIK